MTVPIPVNDLNLLRAENHQIEIYGTFLVPDVLWTAQVNATPSRGDTTFAFDNGSGTNFTAIEPDMPVWVGSTPGGRDIGTLRVRSITSGDGGVTGTLTVARNVLTLVNNYYLSFPNDHPLMPKYPLIVGDPDTADFRKDGDIVYSDQNENLAPVVVAGPHQADFLTGLSITFDPHLENSYPMAPGATITTYAVSCVPSAGFSDTINTSTGVGSIRFAATGKYWVKYTITDSNGTSQSSYRFYYIHSTDPTAPDYPFTDFTCSSINGQWDRGGWSANVNFHADADLTDIYDKQLAIIWGRASYGSIKNTNITLWQEPVRNLITGYLRQSEIPRNLATGVNTVSWTVETIEAVMNSHYMFSVSLEAVNTSPSAWYEFREELTNGRAVHHLWLWHSTLLQMTDVLDLNINTDRRAYAEMEDGTLYSMADDMLLNKGIRHHVVSDALGRLHVTPDISLLDSSERAALCTTVQAIDALDESTDIVISRNPINRTVMTRVSGFYWDGTFETTPTDECPDPPCPAPEAYCGLAPTSQPADEGPTIINLDQQTLKSSGHAATLAGTLFARENALYPDVKVNYHGLYAQVLDVAYPYLWTMTLTGTETLRGITWAAQELICRSVSLTPNHQNGTIKCVANFEPVVDGTPGVLTDCLDELPEETGDDDETGIIPFGEALVTGSSVYLYCGDNNWLLRTPEDVLDLTKDFRWPIRQGSQASCQDAILWYVGSGYVKRSVDAGQNWSDVTPLSNPPNDSGDSPAPTAGGVDYMFVEGNPFVNGQFAVLARWQNAGGDWRSWLLRTDDDGGSWSWVSIDPGSAAGSYTLLDSLATSTPVNETGRMSAAYVGSGNYAACVDSDAGPTIEIFNTTGGTITTLNYDETIDGGLLGSGAFTQVLEVDPNVTPTSGRVLVVFAASAQSNPLDPPDYYVYGLVVTVSNTGNLTYSAPIAIPGTGTGTSQLGNITLLKTLNSGGNAAEFVLVWGDSTGAALNVRRIGVTNTGGLNWGSSNTFTGVAFPSNVQIGQYDPDYFVLGFADFYDGDKPKLVPFRLTSGVFSQGSTVTVSSNAAYVAPFREGVYRIGYNGLGTNDMVYVWIDNTTRSMNLTPVTGNSITNSISLGSPVVLNPKGEVGACALARYTTDTFALFAIDFDSVASEVYYAVQTITNVGGTINVVADRLDLLTFAAGAATTNTNPNILFTSTLNTLYACDHDNQILITPPGGGSNDCKVLDASISKGSGVYIYITKLLNDALYLDAYTLSTLTQNNTLGLGSATESQVNNLTYKAFVTAVWGLDGEAYVYGRLPDVGGNVVHIAYTNDSGVSLAQVVAGYGTDFVGALAIDYVNRPYHIRCTATSSIAYYQLTQKSALPFNTYVNPHAIAVSPAGVLYVAAADAGTAMVQRSVDFGASWGDMTFNHQNVEAVWAVETL